MQSMHQKVQVSLSRCANGHRTCAVTNYFIINKKKQVTHPNDVKGRTRSSLKVSSSWGSSPLPIFLGAHRSTALSCSTEPRTSSISPPLATIPLIEAFRDLFHLVTGGLEKPGAFSLPPEGLKNGSNKLRKGSLQATQHTAHAGQLGLM